MKTKMHLFVGQATHFLKWETPYFRKHFELVDDPADDVILFVFGPDVLETGARLPALRRIALLFPGFGCNPYHDLEHRARSLQIIENYYDLVFVNPGPLREAFKTSPKIVTCNFSIDTDGIAFKRYRTSLDSLLHVSSADYPQKDWQRSEAIMQRTALRHEVFPARNHNIHPLSHRVKRRLNRYGQSLHVPFSFHLMPWGYVPHNQVVKKYQQYDGFVHVAAETPPVVDGKYTAALMEAGLTGAILFWHDTLGLGNDLETVFELPLEPAEAAEKILDIRKDLNVNKHSRLTREEILTRFNPSDSIRYRASKIKELL